MSLPVNTTKRRRNFGMLYYIYLKFQEGVTPPPVVNYMGINYSNPEIMHPSQMRNVAQIGSVSVYRYTINVDSYLWSKSKMNGGGLVGSAL